MNFTFFFLFEMQLQENFMYSALAIFLLDSIILDDKIG